MSPAAQDPLLLSMEGISKRFGPTCALDGVDFQLRRGEVHALLGENGAGKSTLVKILSGALKTDRGRILLAGKFFHPSGPIDSRLQGISMIYQELNLAPHLTVMENIMLGKEVHRWGFLKQRTMRDRVSQTLTFVQHPEIAPNVAVGGLSIGARQLVEIARALLDEARILIMDEPTSSLSREDSGMLFKVIRRMRDRGVGVIYISHFLEEVQKVADRFTILRDGRSVGSGRMSDIGLDRMIQMMVGKKFKEMFPRVAHTPGEDVLSLEGLRGKTMRAPVSIRLRRGEILGVAGLVGAGRTEMLRTIFGLEAAREGEVFIRGAPGHRADPWLRIRQGMGFMSEDRQGEGLALSMSVTDNLTLSDLSPYSRGGILNLRARGRAVEDHIGRLNIRASNPSRPVRTLSGGNQQKVALARLLHQRADILLLDEPTRGIDVLSKSQIYKWMGGLASAGKAIIFVSSYLPELMGVCDRIAVFHRGRLTDVRPVEQWNEESILAAATTGGAERN